LNNQLPSQSIVAKDFCETNCVMWKQKFGGCTADCDAVIGGRVKGLCMWREDEILERNPAGLKRRKQ